MKSFVALDPPNHEGKTNIWLTPRYILDALGFFDLDPCAHPTWPTAKKHYYNNGLYQEWIGRVWLNPPYGKEIIQWITKLQNHGNGIALVFARTDTHWFQTVTPDAINFMKGRVAFLSSEGNSKTNAGTPSMLMAWGVENAKALKGIPGIILKPEIRAWKDGK